MSTLMRATALGLSLLVAACTHPYGMGPGPAAGYGPGWGMGPGMGRGMMGGHGPYGDHWGMGAGPMGGCSPGMMGHAYAGMVWGLERLDLSPEQRAKIAVIQEETGRRHGDLMRAMYGQREGAQGPLDEQGERRAYDAASALHKQMFESQLEARRRVLEVLTPEQREQLGRGRPGR